MNPGFSTAARDGIVRSHGHYASLDLLQGGSVVNTKPILLDEDNGAEVKVDGTQSIRRTFSATLSDPAAYLPLTPTSALSPFLSEVQAWSGIVLPDGTLIRWSVFVGGIEDPKVSATDADLGLTISASDRAQSISERRLGSPFVIAAATTTATAGIQLLLNSVRSNLTYAITEPPSNPQLPAMVIDELEDPWQHAQDMAAAYGLECFFNGAGVCVIRPVPDPDTQSVAWSFTEGVGAIVLGVDTTLTAKSSYSHAIAQGATVSGTAPVRSDAYDTETTSPTWYQGSFGNRPVKLASDLITTQAQADAAALALLARKKGAVQNVSFRTVPLTALDEFDVARVQGSRIGMDAAFTLESFSLPLFPGGTMSPKCRSRRL